MLHGIIFPILSFFLVKNVIIISVIHILMQLIIIKYLYNNGLLYLYKSFFRKSFILKVFFSHLSTYNHQIEDASSLVYICLRCQFASDDN
jgi:hypothetical protein